jgi:hypothetical protein
MIARSEVRMTLTMIQEELVGHCHTHMTTPQMTAIT